MPKKQAPRKRRERKRVTGRDTIVVFDVPEGTEIPRGLGRVGSSEPDEPPRRSRGWTLELASGPFWEGLRKKRESSDPNSPFSRLWDEFQTRAGRIRHAMANPAKVNSADSINQLLEDAPDCGKVL